MPSHTPGDSQNPGGGRQRALAAPCSARRSSRRGTQASIKHGSSRSATRKEKRASIFTAPNVVTHLHTSGSDDEEKRPEFLRLFHGDLSRALNTMLGRERYDEPGTIFDDRPTHVMRLLDAEAQAAHLVYEAVQCVAAGLVRMPGDMPGFVFDFSMWARGAIRVRRPDFFFDPTTRPDGSRCVSDRPRSCSRRSVEI